MWEPFRAEVLRAPRSLAVLVPRMRGLFNSGPKVTLLRVKGCCHLHKGLCESFCRRGGQPAWTL